MAIGLSMILLATDSHIRASDVQRYMAEYWPDLPPITDVDEKE